MSSSSRFGSA